MRYEPFVICFFSHRTLDCLRSESLGSTVDNRVRYAFSSALGCRLVFHEEFWEWIVN